MQAPLLNDTAVKKSGTLQKTLVFNRMPLNRGPSMQGVQNSLSIMKTPFTLQHNFKSTGDKEASQ